MVTEIIYEVFSVFASIGWISIIANIIIDFISFLAFYFSIDKVVLSSILLSIGNSIGDFFGNAALAKQGEQVMGALASYAGQIFNNYIGFGMSILGGASNEDQKFDIFAFDYYKGPDADKRDPPIGNYYLMGEIGFVVISLMIAIIFMVSSGYKLNKKFGILLIIFYFLYFLGSLAFGIIFRG